MSDIKVIEPVAWVTNESMYRLASGGNSRGSVPMHKSKSSTAKVPLYTAEQLAQVVQQRDELQKAIDISTANEQATHEANKLMAKQLFQTEQQRYELQLERDNYKSVAEAHSGAFQECIRLREQRDDLLAALKRLWLSCPTGLECNSFHHAKRDQHDFNQECGPAAEYLAAIEQANATIAKVQK